MYIFAYSASLFKTSKMGLNIILTYFILCKVKVNNITVLYIKRKRP